MELRVARLTHEWRVAFRVGADALEDRLEVATTTSVELAADFEVLRYASARLTEDLELRLTLADRPVVVRPDAPFVLPPRDEIVLYVSTPVWVVLWAAGAEAEIFEAPSFRPSDTWAGPDTTTGELCYASRTRARIDLESLDWRPGRAVTAVTLRNRSTRALDLERINLPMPHLALHHDARHRLWTDGVVAQSAGGGAELDVRVVPPPVDQPTRVAEPRRGPDRNRIARVIGAIFG